MPRPRLERRLRDTAAGGVVALTAPAGYGKSTLVREWAADDPRPFACVDAGRCGDDPVAFARALADALLSLAGDEAPAPRRPRASDVLALADALPSAGVLVVDDAHELCADGALELIAELGRAAAPALLLALVSRGEPRVGLGRLRAERRLLQLQAIDLAMTSFEAREALAAIDVALDEDALAALVARSEGWAAGIVLAGAALQDADDAAAPFAGADHAVAQYVQEELLAPLDGRSRTLLIQSAVLDELAGELCDAALARSGSGRTLQLLSQRGAMLTPLDAAHSWFRCHAMLRDVLRGELEAREPGRIHDVHSRTSAWYASRGDIERALDHAAAARDADAVAELLWSHAPSFLYGRDELVRRWLDALGADVVAAEPRLALCAAHSQLALGDLPAARHWAHVARAAMTAADARQRSLTAPATLIEAAAASDGFEEAARAAGAVDALGRSAGPLRPLAWLLDGVAKHLLGDGDGERARAQLERAVDECATEMPWLEALALTQLALLDVDDEDWERAQERTAKARSCLELAGLAGRPTAALVHAVSALVLSRRGLADEAKGELAAASRLLAALADYVPWYEVQTRVVMARASTRLADVARARTLLSQASRLARRPRPVPRLLASLDDAWAEIDDVSAAALNGPGSLTMAELRVLRFLPTHLSFREIGERLHVSGNTVKSQAHAIYAKLGAGSRSEAVAHAAALGLVDATVV